MGQFPGVCHKQMHNEKIIKSQAGREQPWNVGPLQFRGQLLKEYQIRSS